MTLSLPRLPWVFRSEAGTGATVASVILGGLMLGACTATAGGSAHRASPDAVPPTAPSTVMASAQSPPASSTGSAGIDPVPASPTLRVDPLWLPTPFADAVAALRPGSDPSVLPGPILIADRNNNRILVVDPQGRVDWSWPRTGDLAPGQSFRVPDDAFFTPDGKDIVITQEDDFVITEVDIATRKIVWRYGVPGVHGAGAGRLWNPDDAMLLPSGQIVAADIKNCRLLQLRPGTPSPMWSAGRVGVCRHAPPFTYGSPNGMFPLPDGHFLVTEINGDWVDEIDASGRLYWSLHPPNVAYPSDSNEYKPGEYVTVDYSSPGQVVLFDQAGHTIWRWAPSSGAGRLNHPSLAQGLPNGDIVVNDDRNDRVVVIDPHTNRIVWQYGHTGVPGSGTGYLNNPDGIDPLPPHAYADSFGSAGG